MCGLASSRQVLTLSSMKLRSSGDRTFVSMSIQMRALLAACLMSGICVARLSGPSPPA